MTCKDKPGMIRKKELAEIMSEISDGSYFIYECEDMIMLFREAILKAMTEGKIIQLDGFFRAEPRKYIMKGKKNNITGEKVDIDSTTIKFTVMPLMKDMFKEALEKKGNRNA